MAEELLDEVCKYLQLNEKEYFGITYKVDKNDTIPVCYKSYHILMKRKFFCIWLGAYVYFAYIASVSWFEKSTRQAAQK